MRQRATRMSAVAHGGQLSLLTRAVAAIRRNNGTLLLPGAATPVLGGEQATVSSGTATALTGNICVSANSAVANKTYLVEFEYNVTSGSVQANIGNIANHAQTGVGRFSRVVTPTASNPIAIGCNAATATVTGFTVKEITGYTHGNPALRNYLDSAGTDILDSVTQVDQPVGLGLDSMGVLGADLFGSATRGDTRATVTDIGGGIFKATWTGVADPFIEFTANVGNLRGRSFAVSFDLWTDAGQQTEHEIYAIDQMGYADVKTTGPKTLTTARTTYTLRATGFSQTVNTSSPLIARFDGPNSAPTAGNYVYFTRPVVKEILGNHASQPTTASKPILRRGLLNLQTYSHDLSNAVWGLQDSASKTGSVLNLPLTKSLMYGSFAPAGTHTFAVVLSGTGTMAIWSWGSTDGQQSTQNITLTSTPTVYAFTNTGAGTRGMFVGRALGTATAVTFGGGAYFAGTVTASQILASGGIPLTTTAAASSARGNYWWQFDGSNDSLGLSSGAILQQGSDHFVTAGFTLNAVGVQQTVYMASNTSLANPFIRIIVTSTNQLQCQWRDDAGTLVSIAGTLGGISAGVPYVVTMARIGSVRYAWVNGVALVTSSTALGTTTLITANLAADVRASTTGYLNGNLSGIVIDQGTLTEPDRKLIERFVGSLQGQTL